MDWVVIALSTVIVFSLGAAIGSFLNVVVYRIPAGQSLVHPPSRCPHCQHTLSPQDNIPVLGWILLRGRCRYCRTAIAWRYPLVEALTGFMFLVVFLQFDWSIQTIRYWLLGSWLLALALIDLDTLTLPDVLIKPGLIVGVVLYPWQAYVTAPTTETVVQHGIGAIAGAVVGLWLLDSIRLVASLLMGQEAMGIADPKLAAMIGAWLGVSNLLIALFIACAAGAMLGAVTILLRRRSRRQPIPFGPFLAVGGFVAALWGQSLIRLYLQAVGLVE
ncbi:MAG: prepilin peptidase [Cyanobacteria bacterium]|nr:prepilin peptidase [Cyanobacteriota bacterium]MDW8200558.1 prepilin peptidase [Cyanobacteriota bacterium SKYGB_h_bin112]